MYTDITTLCVGLMDTIHDAVIQMDLPPKGIVLVVDPEYKLLGIITDSDVRRCILGNIRLDEPVRRLLESKAGRNYGGVITAPDSADSNEQLALLREHKILHLPLLNNEQKVTGLVTLDQFVPAVESAVQAVIMAGGEGTRLRPLTDDTPKPMLPMGDQPLMEITIRQLRKSGFSNVNVAVHHKHQKIMEHFGDGKEFGVNISYVTEDRPLGTAGSLGLLKHPEDTVLVINGDILTQLDFSALLDYHIEQRADLTVAVQQKDFQVPYGVVECDGDRVLNLAEKPSFDFLVNAGIYLLEPVVYGLIPNGERYDMTDLIQNMISQGMRVVAFPIREYWIDIGQHEDYRSAQEHLSKHTDTSNRGEF